MPSLDRQLLLITGLIALSVVFAVGVGEYLLHFDPHRRYLGEHYEFMFGASREKALIGHVLVSLFSPIYIVGFLHIHMAIRSSSVNLSALASVVGIYGMVIGSQWMSSRMSLFELVNQGPSNRLIEDYQENYEPLMVVMCVSIVLHSIILAFLIVGGRTIYPKWVFVFTPAMLGFSCLYLNKYIPCLGLYFVPAALNIGFGIFYIISIYIVLTKIGNNEI
ncbi:MAG: hypothetical protein MI867_01705 [Pseudomonadales bacterium]|nr:hypothetical protein [Pseudomonadales bacterium]